MYHGKYEIVTYLACDMIMTCSLISKVINFDILISLSYSHLRTDLTLFPVLFGRQHIFALIG